MQLRRSRRELATCFGKKRERVAQEAVDSLARQQIGGREDGLPHAQKRETSARYDTIRLFSLASKAPSAGVTRLVTITRGGSMRVLPSNGRTSTKHVAPHDAGEVTRGMRKSSSRRKSYVFSAGKTIFAFSVSDNISISLP